MRNKKKTVKTKEKGWKKGERRGIGKEVKRKRRKLFVKGCWRLTFDGEPVKVWPSD